MNHISSLWMLWSLSYSYKQIWQSNKHFDNEFSHPPLIFCSFFNIELMIYVCYTKKDIWLFEMNLKIPMQFHEIFVWLDYQYYYFSFAASSTWVMFANKRDIRLFEMNSTESRVHPKTLPMVKNLHEATGLDFFLQKNKVCWSELPVESNR